MSEQIDWSKAPEGATHRGAINWFKSDGGKVYTFDGAVWHPVSWEIWQLAPFAKRPIIHADEWSGEGLPPVGVVCEVRNKTPGYCAFPWEKCTIALTNIGANGCVQICTIDHRGDFAIYYPEVDIIQFRPIRTTEQIAADERSKAIDEMVKALGMDDPGTAEYIRCGLIYDAGYRKP